MISAALNPESLSKRERGFSGGSATGFRCGVRQSASGSPRTPGSRGGGVIAERMVFCLRCLLGRRWSSTAVCAQEPQWKMSPRRGRRAEEESRKCAARFWKLFPHLSLCLSLVAYAALGALTFQYIEGGSESTTQPGYSEFLGEIVSTVQNLTCGCLHRPTELQDADAEFSLISFLCPR